MTLLDSALLEAAEGLEDEDHVVALAAQGLAEACPRGLAMAFTTRGRPVRAVGAIRGWFDSGSRALAACAAAYPEAPLYYDRARVQPQQRGAWLTLRARFYDSPFYRGMHPFGGQLGRMLVCVGGQLVGFLGVSLPNHDPRFTDQERQALNGVAAKAAPALRIASVLNAARPEADALDHLMASRGDRAFIVTPTGHVLAASPAGSQLLGRLPAARAHIGDAARGAGKTARSVYAGDLELELHVTPCSPRGGACAFLVVASDRPTALGRGRVTDRQAEILDLLRRGMTNRQIGEHLGISPATVKTTLERLYRRAGVSGRVALLRWADLGHGAP